MPIILAHWEAGIRRIAVKSKKVHKTPSQPIAELSGMCD
jgi:hypothetical protein